MTISIGINGFGRIGRTLTRILQEKGNFNLAAINDLAPQKALAHALKYDSIYRQFPGTVESGPNVMIINGREVCLSAERDPANIDWHDIDFVVEATGVFRKRAQVEGHLRGGARKVVMTVPAKDALDATIVMGVNDGELTGAEKLVSNASCTTNASAPITRVIHEAFTIKRGYLNTIHAYTNDQRLLDFPHADFRRSRAASVSIIPSSTGAAKAVAQVIPALTGKLDGTAYRVPVPDGSIVDLLFQVERETTVDEVNTVVKEACKGRLVRILEYQEDPIVSNDILGNSHSGIFDSGLTQVIDGTMVKLAVWYDNEYGYSSRILDLMETLHGLSNR